MEEAFEKHRDGSRCRPTAFEGVVSGEGESRRTVGGSLWIMAVSAMASISIRPVICYADAFAWNDGQRQGLGSGDEVRSVGIVARVSMDKDLPQCSL